MTSVRRAGSIVAATESAAAALAARGLVGAGRRDDAVHPQILDDLAVDVRHVRAAEHGELQVRACESMTADRKAEMINSRPTGRVQLLAVWCLVLAGMATLVAQAPGAAGVTDSRILRRSYLFDDTGRSIPYAVFVPPAYDQSMPTPLIVALHGVGRSYDSIMGYERFLDLAAQRGYLVVTPLGYSEFGWFGSAGPGLRAGPPPDVAALDPPPANLGERSERDVMNVLGRVRQEFSVDGKRIFLFGHSMGGGGAYHLAATYPNTWRAVAVAAPAPDASMAQLERVTNLPFLVLQGDADAQVSPAKTRATIDLMKSLGMTYAYVEIPGGDHRFIERDPMTLARVFAFFADHAD